MGIRTRVVEILSKEGRKEKEGKMQVVLADAPFHPGGGGQPGDTGTLHGDTFRADVLDARKRASDGATVLDLRLNEGFIDVGMEAVAQVDLERNAILSRMHTGQHLFSRIQENACENLETLKVNIGVEESVVYIRYEKELTWESLFEAEEKTVEAIRRNLPVESFTTSREEAEKLPELKAKWPRIHDERIRIVRVAGIDATACSGTHVSHTGEIGGFMVTGFNGTVPGWEVRFTVRTEEASREYTRAARRLAREVGCPADRLTDVFARLRAENAALSQTLERVRGFLSVPWEERSLGGHSLFFATLPGLTKDLLSPHARRRIAENPDAIGLVLLPGATDEPFPFILLRGRGVDIDLTTFAESFPELRIRGGGKADWLNGTTTERSTAAWAECLARMSEAPPSAPSI